MKVYKQALALTYCLLFLSFIYIEIVQIFLSFIYVEIVQKTFAAVKQSETDSMFEERTRKMFLDRKNLSKSNLHKPKL